MNETAEELPRKFIQLKIGSGEELLCELTEVQKNDLMVKGCLKLYHIAEDTGAYIVLRPWMTNQISFEHNTQSINKFQIIAKAIPNKELMEQYFTTLKYIEMNDSDRKNALVMDSAESFRLAEPSDTIH